MIILPHFLHFLEATYWPESARGYAFWSSIGSCGAYLTIIAVAYRTVNCHTPGCKRISAHTFHDPHTGEVHKVCNKHHPRGRKKTQADMNLSYHRGHTQAMIQTREEN